jgi:hypothetical protein
LKHASFEAKTLAPHLGHSQSLWCMLADDKTKPTWLRTLLWLLSLLWLLCCCVCRCGCYLKLVSVSQFQICLCFDMPEVPAPQSSIGEQSLN